MTEPLPASAPAALPHRPRGTHTRLVVRSIARLALTGGVLLALWLTWKPDGSLMWYSARWERFIDWFNDHGELRNLPAYFLLAVPAFLSFRYVHRWRVLAGMLAFASCTEFGQLLVRTRFFDWNDIVLSWLGIGFAFAAYTTLCSLLRRTP